MADQDRDWVRRAREGDLSAFDHLVEKYMDRAYAVAYRMVGHPQDAEDVTQEAFAKAFSGLRGFRGDASFYTWLYRIVVHLCQDHLRKRRFRSRFTAWFRAEPDQERTDPPEERMPDPSWRSNPEAVLQASQTRSAVDAALEALPPRQRSIFVLKHFQGLPIREIAQILRVTEGTVKTHLFRAVQALRRSLEEQGEVPW